MGSIYARLEFNMMSAKNYTRLGKLVTDYVMSDAFSDEDLGKTIEQLYLLIAQENMRDFRDFMNGKTQNEIPTV